MVTLPVEIIERILYFADGKTLLTAKHVDETWEIIVNFLSEQTNIWERCCREDIPRNELVNYNEKYEDSDEKNKWFNIYKKWLAWQNIKSNVFFTTILAPADIPRITNIAVSGSLIAVGSEDGRVRLFGSSWQLLHTARYQAVKITDLKFIKDDATLEPDPFSVFILIRYNTGTLIITQYDGKLSELTRIPNVKLHSVFKKYICFEQNGGRVTISKLCKQNKEHSSEKYVMCEVTFLRIYSPNEISCLHMWRGVATFLINNEVKYLNYENGLQPVSAVENKVKIKFCLKNHPKLKRICHIYRDDIIICSCTSSDMEQYLELFILGSQDQYSKKLFDSWEVLQACISSMFLHGSTFVLGDDVGNIYIYNISSWKLFDIRHYERKIIIGRHPIIDIDVKDTKEERRFYVASNFNIHEVVGTSPLVL